MLILRLTSPSYVRGIESDVGLKIGAFSGDTLFLVGLTAFAGAFFGAAYVTLRRLLPGSRRPAIVGVVLGTVGGAAVIEPGGVDFTLLERGGSPSPSSLRFPPPSVPSWHGEWRGRSRGWTARALTAFKPHPALGSTSRVPHDLEHCLVARTLVG
jgi:hypothetical protein